MGGEANRRFGTECCKVGGDSSGRRGNDGDAVDFEVVSCKSDVRHDFESVNKAGTGDAGGYTNVDLTLGYNFEAAGLDNKVQVYARNMGDEDYESVCGFLSLGRVVGATYRVVF